MFSSIAQLHACGALVQWTYITGIFLKLFYQAPTLVHQVKFPQPIKFLKQPVSMTHLL